MSQSVLEKNSGNVHVINHHRLNNRYKSELKHIENTPMRLSQYFRYIWTKQFGSRPESRSLKLIRAKMYFFTKRYLDTLLRESVSLLMPERKLSI